MKEKLLTDEEYIVVGLLSSAWNSFCLLPELHPDHKSEMTNAIHTAQDIIMARPVQREFNTEDEVYKRGG